MPPRASLTVTSSQGLARRIAYERERRDWKQTTLARRMTDAGFEMTQSTISKFERADDARRITVDELVAFATVFGIRVQDLLVPLPAVLSREVERVMRRHRDANAAFSAAIDEVIEARSELGALMARADELGDTQLEKALSDWWSEQVRRYAEEGAFQRGKRPETSTDAVKRRLHNALVMWTGEGE